LSTADDKVLTDSDLRSDWYKSILYSINDGVFCVDKDFKVACFNRAASEITGVAAEEAIGKPCHEVLRSDFCGKNCPLAHTMETGEPLINLTVNIINAKGERLPVSVSTSLFRDAKGNVIGGVETFRDLRLVEQLKRGASTGYAFENIISRSPKMYHVFNMLPNVAESDSTVLITGESGTGKGLVAQACHKLSARRGKPFIVVNCGTIPDTLLESELFGYKAGAFTNAVRDKPGRFALANHGTIFLDEIGDISPSIQAKLLRVIEDRVFEPLGGVESVSVDVRILAATHMDLAQLVQDGAFRTDLFYRLNVIDIKLPPLRGRIEDVPLLVSHFIHRFCHMKGKNIVGISPEAMSVLMSYDFPGNVRELENIIEHAFALCRGGIIEPRHLPAQLNPKSFPKSPGPMDLLEKYERELIISALRKNNWNRLKTAEDLGIHKTTLYRKLRKLNIVAPKSSAISKGSSSATVK
jgi:PAS domain S-box-containing protein